LKVKAALYALVSFPYFACVCTPLWRKKKQEKSSKGKIKGSDRPVPAVMFPMRSHSSLIVTTTVPHHIRVVERIPVHATHQLRAPRVQSCIRTCLEQRTAPLRSRNKPPAAGPRLRRNGQFKLLLCRICRHIGILLHDRQTHLQRDFPLRVRHALVAIRRGPHLRKEAFGADTALLRLEAHLITVAKGLLYSRLKLVERQHRAAFAVDRLAVLHVVEVCPYSDRQRYESYNAQLPPAGCGPCPPRHGASFGGRQCGRLARPSYASVRGRRRRVGADVKR